jgi:hypothetical protein
VWPSSCVARAPSPAKASSSTLGVNATSMIQFMVNESCNWRRTLGWKVGSGRARLQSCRTEPALNGALAPEVLTQPRLGGIGKVEVKVLGRKPTTHDRRRFPEDDV